MGRLIDAERRQRILEGFARHLMEAGKVEAAEAVHTLIKGLKLEPTVDAVPVVRCKDCKHWQYRENGFGDCKNPRFHIPGVAEITMNAEDYCSLGERRAE